MTYAILFHGFLYCIGTFKNKISSIDEQAEDE